MPIKLYSTNLHPDRLAIHDHPGQFRNTDGQLQPCGDILSLGRRQLLQHKRYLHGNAFGDHHLYCGRRQ
ncbi:MAG: hypothetical protein A3F73_07795 [Gallionellales bacterium RIFCSPLOWO2_12_FULL_59_22]|nr:MAG: hypothetical protein A3F73_07795 [Gallionellales bacterium RIFCSPLOWO2_12_FULL_59_22]